jgi:hypothetical protein
MNVSFSYCTHQSYLLNATEAQNHAAYYLQSPEAEALGL